MLGALRTALTDLVAECDQTCGADTAVADPLACPIIAALDAPTHDQRTHSTEPHPGVPSRPATR